MGQVIRKGAADSALFLALWSEFCGKLLAMPVREPWRREFRRDYRHWLAQQQKEYPE